MQAGWGSRGSERMRENRKVIGWGKVAALAIFMVCSACSGADETVPGQATLEAAVRVNRVGQDADQWIEMRSMAGGWDRVGLIFGYRGDSDECRKAIAGLKRENYARQYRCTPAN